MLIEDRHTGRSQEIPVCTNATFHSHWERAAVEEGLEMVQALGGLFVTPDYRERFLGELAKLKTWAVRGESDDYPPATAQHVDGIIAAIRAHPFDDYDISFG